MDKIEKNQIDSFYK